MTIGKQGYVHPQSTLVTILKAAQIACLHGRSGVGQVVNLYTFLDLHYTQDVDARCYATVPAKL